jgi:hypothetical protein
LIDLGDCAHFETEPFVIHLPLPPIGTALDMELAFDETYHLPYLVSIGQDTSLSHAFPAHFHQNVYILAVADQDHVTVEDVLITINSNQSANAVISIEIWIVKRNNNVHTDLEEQRMMYDQVLFVPVLLPSLPEIFVCRAVAYLHKPECPEYIEQMMKSPFKADFKGSHFENNDKMYSTGTWSYPLLRSIIPPEAVLLPLRPAYTVKSTTMESLWELQVRSCANGARMKQGVHFDHRQLSSPHPTNVTGRARLPNHSRNPEVTPSQRYGN